MPASRKLLCAVYATIAVAAVIATWSQNLAYFNNPLAVLAVVIMGLTVWVDCL
jgi:hypothetical protein